MILRKEIILRTYAKKKNLKNAISNNGFSSAKKNEILFYQMERGIDQISYAIMQKMKISRFSLKYVSLTLANQGKSNLEYVLLRLKLNQRKISKTLLAIQLKNLMLLSFMALCKRKLQMK